MQKFAHGTQVLVLCEREVGVNCQILTHFPSLSRFKGETVGAMEAGNNNNSESLKLLS